MAVTSYGRNKNHDDEIKKTKRRPIIASAIAVRLLKKRQRPNTIQILWIVKNQEHRNIATLSLQLRSYKNKIKPWVLKKNWFVLIFSLSYW